jgi:hypothetical protein
MISKAFSSTTVIIALLLCGHSAVGQEVVKELLGHPLGTISKMVVEVVDGDKLKDKYHTGTLLFKVKRVDSSDLPSPVILDFKDETGTFPLGDFVLNVQSNGKRVDTLSTRQEQRLRKNLIGKSFTIMAYESGLFTGVLDRYFEYQPVRQDFGFHFRHYLVIVSVQDNQH